MGRLEPASIPRHVAIIPDGNGRWAESRGLARNEGHSRGTEVVREIVRAAHELGIKQLTIYAFSMENWDRPQDEIDAIMGLLSRYIRHETDELEKNGVRVQTIGRLDMLSPKLQRAIRGLEKRTAGNDEMLLIFALSYSGRSELVDAMRGIAREVESGRLDPEAIEEKDIREHLYAPDLPDPDLLIRTGVEHRISNFMLWQLAYTELWITDALWPDFTKRDLVDAIHAYQQRERRFGRTGAQVRKGS
ncbi:MAG: isoprenyl transferase [Myxococcota bacterium]